MRRAVDRKKTVEVAVPQDSRPESGTKSHLQESRVSTMSRPSVPEGGGEKEKIARSGDGRGERRG